METKEELKKAPGKKEQQEMDEKLESETMQEANVEENRPRRTLFIPSVMFIIFLTVGAMAYLMPKYGPKVLSWGHDTAIEMGNYFPGLNKWMKFIHESDKGGDEMPVIDGHDWMAGRNKDLRLKLLTNDDIKYTEGGKLFLVLVGHVFDVTSGFEYYKPGSGYHGFIGRDGSRAFVSGDFTDTGLTDDLSGLDLQDYTGLADWLKFYLFSDKYKFVGYHVGRFFDDRGEETQEMAEFKEHVRNAKVESEKEGDLQKIFPLCNVEWTAEKGSTVWCSHASGGVDRDWIGWPRKFFEAPNKAARCACVHPNFLADPRVKVYEGCATNEERCKLLETDK